MINLIVINEYMTIMIIIITELFPSLLFQDDYSDSDK